MKNVQKWNWTGKRKPSGLQRKRLLALALMEIIKTTLCNHVYQFNGELYRQLCGGPIGDNLTNLMSKLIMFTFSKKYKAKLDNLGLLDRVVLLKIIFGWPEPIWLDFALWDQVLPWQNLHPWTWLERTLLDRSPDPRTGQNPDRRGSHSSPQ